MTVPASPLVSPEWLRDRLGSPNLCIVDCHFALHDPGFGRQQYAQGHIPGAYYLDLNEDLSSPATGAGGRHPLPDSAEFGAILTQLGIYSQDTGNPTQVIAYDNAGGAFAARCWWLLRYLGHEQVSVLDGGWAGWRDRDYPVSQVVPPARTGQFTPQVQTDWVVDRAIVQQVCHQPRVRLIDARAPERYRGDVEPIDPVAGHIPGAINVFWKTNLAETGQWRSPAALREQWQTQADLANADQVIMYCGSGVTACANLLSLAIADLPPGQLYAGSWSDWCVGIAAGTVSAATA